MANYTVTFTDEQENHLDDLQISLKAHTRSQLFAKVLALASLIVEAHKNNKSVGIETTPGKFEKINIF